MSSQLSADQGCHVSGSDVPPRSQIWNQTRIWSMECQSCAVACGRQAAAAGEGEQRELRGRTENVISVLRIEIVFSMKFTPAKMTDNATRQHWGAC